MTSAPNDRPIIVLGCPRSGTTIVQVMLHSHHRIAIPPENRFLLPAYRQRLSFGDLEERANRRALARFIVRGRRHKFRDFGLDRKETIREIVNGPATLGSALGIVLRAYAARFGSERWGDKRPSYHNYIGAIMRLFPDAQIVHVVRDPRDCVASLKRMPWWRLDSHHSVAAWAEAVEHVDEAVRRWPGAVTQIQYERLVADPETELRRLCDALGEEYDAAMAEPERLAPLAVPERKHWHSYTRVRLSTRNVGRWRRELEGWEVALCEAVLADRMERFGYEPVAPGRPPLRDLARFASVRAARRTLRRTWLLRDRWDRRREPNRVAALLTRGQRAAAGL